MAQDMTTPKKAGVKEEIERLQKHKATAETQLRALEASKGGKFIDAAKIDNQIAGAKEDIKRIDASIAALQA